MASSITLSQLQHSIKESLSQQFPLPIWVSAEISELKVNYSGHCYLELVEKGATDGIAKAQARAVVWRNNYAALSTHFFTETGQQLGAGMKVLVKVLINFHEIYGLSLQITDIDPTYTLGETERQRQLTIAQLKADGVWGLNGEQFLPKLVQRIAVVSSRNAAGYQDFSQEIARSGYHFEISLYDSFMQGAGAEESIIEALGAIAQEEQDFDAVVIIRGGGSVADLNCFNNYRLASHVAQFPLPIIAGIGHDKDVSVVDMVAHTTLKTPTAVAVWLTERMAQIEGWLERVALAMHDATATITRSSEIRLERYTTDISHLAAQLIDTRRTALKNIEESLPERIEQMITTQRTRLQSLTQSIELHSPAHLLRLGFAVARVDGKALRSTDEVAPNQQICIELADGEIITKVQKINK